MILFHSENDFSIQSEQVVLDWISKCIHKLKKDIGDINYIFCDDEYLLSINKEYLNHDTYTDIISFDYSEGNTLNGDIYISIERVKENAKTYKVSYSDELHRVLIHGVLHFAGFKDKTTPDQKEMTKQENYYLSLRDLKK
jgi:rRNA maturation RNase YbeY